MSNKLSEVIKKGLESFLKTKAEYDAKAEKGPFGYHEDFANLRQKTLQYREEKIYPTTEGEKPHNYRKNRYKDIMPYDYTRVELNKINDMSGTDYINANYIKGANDRVMYIAAQGPLPNTVKDFWRMLFETNTKVVLMACSEYEGDPPKHKCQRYWPESVDEEMKFDKITVTLESEEDTAFNDYKIRHIRAECNQEVHKIHQLHYIGWPDHGVPENVVPLIDMITHSRNLQSEDSPAITVHCSAGCGRTGTIIAVDIAWNLLKMGKLTTDFNLYNIIDDIRKQRPSLVQSLDQYKFVFEVVAELFERHLDIMNKHAYENVQLLGKDVKEDASHGNNNSDLEAMEKTESNPNARQLSAGTKKAIRQTINKLNRNTAKIDIVQSQISRNNSVENVKPSAPPKPSRFTSTSHSGDESPQPKAETVSEGNVSIQEARARFEKSSAEPSINHNHSRTSSHSSRSSTDSLPHKASRPTASPRTSLGTPRTDKNSDKQMVPADFDTYSMAQDEDSTIEIADVCQDESNDLPQEEKNDGQSGGTGDAGQNGDDYAYANPYQKDKWAFQHIALGISAVGDENAYSEVALPTPPAREESMQPSQPEITRTRSKQKPRGPAYEEIPDPQRPMMQPPMTAAVPNFKKQEQEYNPYALPDDELSDEDDIAPPAVPEKNIRTSRVDSEDTISIKSNESANIAKTKKPAFFNKLKLEKRKSNSIGLGINKTKTVMDPHEAVIREIMFDQSNIGFPNRIRKPVGPRPFPKE